MKRSIFIAVIAIVAIFLVYNLFGSHKSFDTKPYEARIDSLQKEVDSTLEKNSLLTIEEQKLVQANDLLLNKANGLKHTIIDLKKDHSHVKLVYSYTPTQVDSFFLNRYTKAYQEPTKDTTHLPIPVAKAAVVDILELDKTKNVLEKTDSLVEVQSNLISGKDEVISVLKSKETNYQSVINLQIKQQENYKTQIFGLKDDIKKSKKSIRNQKIKTFLLGAAVIILAATHK